MVEIEFGTSSAFKGWVRVLGYGFGMRGRKVKSRDYALASDLVRATEPAMTWTDDADVTCRLITYLTDDIRLPF